MTSATITERPARARRAAKAAPAPKRALARAPSETSISMRISLQMLDLITTAAAVMGKSRTEFMIESARQDAVEVLLDQRLFVLGDEQHDAFMRALDNPPAPNARLRQLFAEKAPWEA